MTDLLIINPGGRRRIYQGLADDLAAIEPPLWARLIAGYCRDRGHSVEILDARALDMGAGVVGRRVNIERPRLVCIAAYGHQPSASTQSMEEVVRLCKAIPSDIPVIVVGGHAAALPAETARETKRFVCNSEGPVTVETYLRTRDAASCPGLGWEKIGGGYEENPAPPLLDVALLHGRAWDLLPMDRYRAHNWQCFGAPRQPYASIYTSLGCPYKCSFCCINAPFGTNVYRMREPSDVVNEIVALNRNYGIRTFKITDEMFVLNERHYTAICEGLAGINDARWLNIWAYARIDTVKPETLGLMKDAGINWLALGIESGSAHVRDGAKKHLGDQDIIDTVRAIQAAGINVIGNFIFGLPDDTHGTMIDTLVLAKNLNCEFANFYVAMAYPGSALHSHAVTADLPETWGGYSQHSIDTRPLPNANLTSKQIVEFRDKAFDTYFTGTQYLNMVERRFGAGARAEIEAMTARTLERVG